MSKVQFVQFGEGGFLRGFVDWMIHKMNQQGLLDSGRGNYPVSSAGTDLRGAFHGRNHYHWS